MVQAYAQLACHTGLLLACLDLTPHDCLLSSTDTTQPAFTLQQGHVTDAGAAILGVEVQAFEQEMLVRQGDACVAL